MKSLSAAITLACVYAALFTSSSTAAPTSFDYSQRAEANFHLARRSLISDATEFSKLPFTHVVIGGGTAGLAVAVRLSEVPTNYVGVLEAGLSGLGDSINEIPGVFGGNLGGKYDWNYT
jgi:hypothetical protein